MQYLYSEEAEAEEDRKDPTGWKVEDANTVVTISRKGGSSEHTLLGAKVSLCVLGLPGFPLLIDVRLLQSRTSAEVCRNLISWLGCLL